MSQGPSSSARTRETLSPSGCNLDLSKNPRLEGSGQFGTPCERMQRAKASAGRGVVRSAGVDGAPPAQSESPHRHSRPRAAQRGGRDDGWRMNGQAHTVRSASVGDMRAARTAGRRPARAPMRRRRRGRPPRRWWGSDLPVFGRRRRSRSRATPAPTPTAPPMSASRIASERNCVRMSRLVAPSDRRSPISERRSRTRDEHDVADADGADEQRHRAEPEEEAVERALRLGARGERGGGLADVDLVRRFRVGGGGEDRLDRGRLARDAADVDRGRVAVEAEVALGRGEADEDGGVDLGRERGRVEDAGEVEPHPSEPDALARVEAVDPEPLRGGVAEHGDRLARGGRVEIFAGGDGGADRRRQAEARRLHRERVRVDRGDERAAVDVRASSSRCTAPAAPGRCGRSSPARRAAALPSARTGSARSGR